jgi:eukaryotic-like serine/threonine-protein kinase
MATRVQTGDILAGKFRVERILGRGGMGVVVSATNLDLDTPVALKLLRGDVRDRPDMVARFRREARAAAKLRSEHIARVYDVGSLADDTPYIVSELLEGRDLSALTTERGPLPPATAVDYLLQACLGIAEAHAKGIVHRDLKPANLFLTTRSDGSPLVKVLDFGIAKTPADWETTDHAETDTTQILGSPAFMSPEQMRSAKRVDARTDIWALGAILYTLVTERPPFRADTFPELCLKILQEPPAPPRLDLPEPLWEVIETCLQKDREARFSDVAALGRRLAPLATVEGRRLEPALAEVLARANTAPDDGAHAEPAASAIAGIDAEARTLGETEASADTAAPLGSVPSVRARSPARPPRARRYALVGGAAVAAAAVAIALALSSQKPGAPPEPGVSASVPAALSAPAPSGDAIPDPVATLAPRDASPIEEDPEDVEQADIEPRPSEPARRERAAPTGARPAPRAAREDGSAEVGSDDRARPEAPPAIDWTRETRR